MYVDRRSRYYGLTLGFLVHLGIAIILLWKLPSGAGGQAKRDIAVFDLAPPAIDTEVDRGHGAEPKTGKPKAVEPHELPLPDAKADRSPANGGPAKDASSGAAAAATKASPAAQGEVRVNFQEVLLKHIERFRHFPDDARQAHQQGTVLVGFVIVREGAVLDFWIAKSSGFPSLDREALATLQRARPLPHIPDELPDQLQVELPVSFDLN